MKQLTGLWKMGKANLASVVVTLADFARYPFPPGRVFPFRNTAFPGGVTMAAHTTTKNNGLSLRANGNPKFSKEFIDRGSPDVALDSNTISRAKVDRVLTVEPIAVFVRRILSVVSIHIDIPSVLALVPSHSRATATLAHWRTANRNIFYWFASLTVRVGFPGIANSNPVATGLIS